MHAIDIALSLIEELAVGVRSKQCLSYGRQRTGFKELQPRFERVVDLDLAIPTEDSNAAGTVTPVLLAAFY